MTRYRHSGRRKSTHALRVQKNPLEMKSLSSLRTQLDRVRRTLADFPMALERWEQEYASIKTQYDEQFARWRDFRDGWKAKVQVIETAIKNHADENYKRRSWFAKSFGPAPPNHKEYNLTYGFLKNLQAGGPIPPFVAPEFFKACSAAIATLETQWEEAYQRLIPGFRLISWDKWHSDWYTWEVENDPASAKYHFPALPTIDRQRFRGFSLSDKGLVEANRLEQNILAAIPVAEAREKAVRQECGADDRTIAAAAAHFGKTRDLAYEVKKQLRDQVLVLPVCPYCGGPLGDEPHADHIHPVCLGGLSMTDNMVYVCAKCNHKKHDKTLREFLFSEELNRSEIEERLAKLGKRF